ncbi:zinc finger, CCHC-type containing protein [Tanacetum coccineum]
MKDLVANKQLTKEDDEIRMSPKCSTLLQNLLPPKENDPGSFILPCSIGRLEFNNALADLGASISIMPFFKFKRLGIGKLEPINMAVEMADNTTCTPKGIIKNLLIKIDKFILPVDFVILYIIEDFRMPVILGRPLLATTHAKESYEEIAYRKECKKYGHLVTPLEKNVTEAAYAIMKLNVIRKVKTMATECRNEYDDSDEFEDPDGCRECKKNEIFETIINKLHDEWFKGTDEDDKDLEEIIDYLEPTLYDGFIDSDDEEYKERKCRFLGMPYIQPPLILIEKVNVTRYSIGPGEVYRKIKISGVEKLSRTRGNIATIRAEIMNEILENDDKEESYSETALVRLSDPKKKTLGEKGIDCIFVRYAEHSKAYRFYVIEPNDSVSINSIIESRDAIFNENRFSSIPRPKDILPNLEECQRDDHSDDVPKAIDDEIGSIMENNTRVLFDLPPGCKPLGFRQKEGINYFDTYAPVTRIGTIRLLLALTAIQDLVIHQMDVKITFLNDELDGEVYMKQPEGFVMPGNEHKVCKMAKSLYRLKQASKQWHQKFDEVVLSSGFLLNQSDKFSMKDMGEADIILGIKIKRRNKGIVITQSHYIEKILKKFNREDCSPVSTPMDPVEKLKPNTGKLVDQLEYSRAIGCLMYAMTSKRPDIAYAVGRLSSFTSNPSRQH